ncbi:CoA transferase [Allopusillimonas soli]|uniref:CoA transferase n=1 Tax=Allopusillimonas soli TaxID=659016 RepID=A0A853F821_9BURK|nr:CoA transferase [Allopusillimonas soli]NYT35968.1 CoA transferase [Allopusillimonas soli]TEA76315.1 CoA transferase [Allopusillimonas soli]
MRPLEGTRIVDLSKVVAGPLCAQYLGDLGADVIKVEPPGVGDDTRAWLPKKQGESATFLAVNHNKRSIAVDLKTEQGRAIVHELVKRADVVIQGFGAGTAQRLHVDYDTLRTINERLIYCEISGYGRNGPMGGEPGYDVMLQAFSGMLSTIGQKDGTVARVSFSPVDMGTGMHAVSGILAALLNRSTTGKGAYVEVSLLDTAMGYMSYMAHNFWASGRVPSPQGTAHPSLCPYQAFRTQDGQIMLGVGNDRLWQRFCREAGLQAHMDAPEFATNENRVAHFDQTCDLVQARLLEDTTASWLLRLQAAGVPSAPLHTLDQALGHEQLQARGLVVSSEHATLGDVQHIAYPVAFDHQPRTPRRAPPVLGEHTREILAEIGIDDIDALLAGKIVAS